MTREEVYQAAVKAIRAELKLDESAPTVSAPPVTAPARAPLSANSLLDHVKNVEPASGGVTLGDLKASLDFQDVRDAEIDEALRQLVSDGRLFHVAADSGEKFTTQRPMPTKVGVDRLREAVVDIFQELLVERYGTSGQVPIHEIRSAIARQFGADAARHVTLDDVIRSLREDGYRLAPISNTRYATPEQIEASIAGMGGETHFYLEEVG